MFWNNRIKIENWKIDKGEEQKKGEKRTLTEYDVSGMVYSATK